ncbi:MAG TPA: MFS transporter [Candidatus Dormibacteraeota bacterium]
MSVASVSRRTFSSLRHHRNYRLYFYGQVISISGTWMQNVAAAWFIVVLTHSPIAVGVLAACQFGPYALFGLFGGAFADRLDQRRVLMATQSAFALSAAALAGLALSGHASPWEVYLLVAVNGTVTVLDTPARQAFTVQMVGRAELPNAIALNSSLFNASRIIGPAIAGTLIAVAGVGLCFLINSISYLAVIGALWLMHSDELHRVARDEKVQTVLRGAAEGVRFAWHTPLLRTVLLMMLFISTIGINFNVLLPVLTSETLHAGPQVFGVISAAFGAGALGGALFSASLGRTSARALLAGAALFSAAELILSPLHVVWAAAVTLAALGFAFSLYSSQSNASLQLNTPDRLRGRVMGIYGYVFFGTAPLGGLLAGWMAQVGGTELAFVVAGAVSLATAFYGRLELQREASLAAHLRPATK